MAYRRFLSAVGRRRQRPYLRRQTEEVQSDQAVIPLNAGLAHPALFPYRTATLRLQNGRQVELGEEIMQEVQQYSNTTGYPPFLDWCKNFILEHHNPPCWGRGENATDVIVTNGAAEAAFKVLEMCLESDDTIIVQNPTYASAIDLVQALGAKPVGVPGDGRGISPLHLRETLSKWTTEEVKDPNSDFPKLMYLVPTGGNPTGENMTLERKREIYAIAQEFDLLILEDDPYYFVQYTDSRVPSFLSIDTDGRVMRADSFSKTVSPGLRLGILSGPAPLVDKIVAHIGSTQEHSSNLSQVALLMALEAWGREGFQEHVQKIQSVYKGQRDAMQSSAEKWLSGLAEWELPEAGIYFWIRIKNVQDSRKIVEEVRKHHQIGVSPGFAFSTNPSDPSPFVRVSFSYVAPDTIDFAFQKLADVIRETQKTERRECGT